MEPLWVGLFWFTSTVYEIYSTYVWTTTFTLGGCVPKSIEYSLCGKNYFIYKVPKHTNNIRQENTSINAQENELRYSIFVLILVTVFQKRPKAAFSRIKTTR